MISSQKFFDFAIVVALNLTMLGRVSFCQGVVQSPSSSVDAVMSRVLSRSHSITSDGVEEVSWAPPTKEDVAEIKGLGEEAVMPLARYLQTEKKDGFAELLAVKFLIIIGTPSTFQPLTLALAPEQWEVTRAQALSGIYQLSKDKAKLYILAALNDKSELVNSRAHELLALYPPEP